VREVHLDPCTLCIAVSIDGRHERAILVLADVIREIGYCHREVSGRSVFPLITKVDPISPTDRESRFPRNIETSSADDSVENDDFAIFQLNSLRQNSSDTFKNDCDVLVS
jgi:hypothetical protein